MATWQTEIQKTEANVSNFFNTSKTKIDDTFRTNSNKVIADVKSFFQNGSTVVGIKVSGIGPMQHAVTNYVAGVDAAIDELVNAETTIAFQGEYASKVKEYIQALIEVLQAIGSQMLIFNDKLDEVKAAYEAKDTSTAQQIGQEASAARSSYTRYGSNTN